MQKGKTMENMKTLVLVVNWRFKSRITNELEGENKSFFLDCDDKINGRYNKMALKSLKIDSPATNSILMNQNVSRVDWIHPWGASQRIDENWTCVSIRKREKVPTGGLKNDHLTRVMNEN